MKRLYVSLIAICVIAARPALGGPTLEATVPVPDWITEAAQIALGSYPNFGSAPSYIITDLSQTGDTYTLSMARMVTSPNGPDLEENLGIYTLTIVSSDSGTIVYPLTPIDLQPDPSTARYTRELPWRDGSMSLGPRGVHDLGYGLAGWLAVDWVSQGQPGQAPNMVYAAEAGEISYICRDATQLSMRVGDLFYAHLVDGGYQIGHHFEQGDPIGPLVTGSFDDWCGWASQPEGDYHLHWGFPPGDFITAGGWVLDTHGSTWRRPGEAVGIGQSIVSEWSTP